MPESPRWRLSVRLQDGNYAQTVTLDFVCRDTVESQRSQLLFKQCDYNCPGLFEFRNESGELLAFRAFAYHSHSVTALDTLATAV